MKTGMPVSWTVQKHLEKVRAENWKTAREKEAGKPQKRGESWRLCPAGESSQIKKLTQAETKEREETQRGLRDDLEGSRCLGRPLGRGSYLGRRRSHRSRRRDASLDRYVAARCCHGNCNRGGEEGGDDWEGKEPRTVVAVDDGRGTAVIGSSIVDARGTDVSPLPGSPVVPLKAVVVA